MIRTNDTFLQYIEELYRQRIYSPEEITKTVFDKADYLLFQEEKATQVLLIKSGVTKCFFEEENERAYIIEFWEKERLWVILNTFEK